MKITETIISQDHKTVLTQNYDSHHDLGNIIYAVFDGGGNLIKVGDKHSYLGRLNKEVARKIAESLVSRNKSYRIKA